MSTSKMLAIPTTPVAPHVNSHFENVSGSILTQRSPAPSMLISMPNKRPKLSLQTTSVPTATGKSSTGLALSAQAISAASPTILNTFNNAYELPHRPSPTQTPKPTSRFQSPITAIRFVEINYKLPLSIKSVLKNSRIAPCEPSPRTGRRPLFPAAKQVSFREVIEEEIHNVDFIARHSDLDSETEGSSEDDVPKTPIDSQALPEDSEVDVEDDESEDGDLTERKRKKRVSESKLQAAADTDKSKSIAKERPRKSCRRKREWVWTLGPINGETTSSREGSPAQEQVNGQHSRPILSLQTSSSASSTEEEAAGRRCIRLQTPFPKTSVRDDSVSPSSVPLPPSV